MPDPEFAAAIFVPLGLFSIPIVAILARHQHRMAELMYRGPNVDPGMIEHMRRMQMEIDGLKEIIHTQALAMDDQMTLRKIQTEMPPVSPIGGPV